MWKKIFLVFFFWQIFIILNYYVKDNITPQIQHTVITRRCSFNEPLLHLITISCSRAVKTAIRFQLKIKSLKQKLQKLQKIVDVQNLICLSINTIDTPVTFTVEKHLNIITFKVFYSLSENREVSKKVLRSTLKSPLLNTAFYAWCEAIYAYLS